MLVHNYLTTKSDNDRLSSVWTASAGTAIARTMCPSSGRRAITCFLSASALCAPSLEPSSAPAGRCVALPFLWENTGSMRHVPRGPVTLCALHLLPLKNLMMSVKSMLFSRIISLYISTSARATKSTKCCEEVCLAAQMVSHRENTSS